MLRRILLLMPAFVGFSLGQEVGTLPRSDPALFALVGATVVVGDGQVHKGATLLIRDGLIEAVGEQVSVPPGAWKIDLSGMFLYPGLIDALTEAGLKKGAAPARARSGQSAPARPSSEDKESPGLRAHLHAADRLEEDAGKLESWRNAGVLVLHVAPKRGIFRGQTALVAVAGHVADQRIVRSPVAMPLAFRGLGFRTYPGSLMGVIAHIRQTLLDARHYARVHAIYRAHPRGLERPETDRELEALGPVVEGKMPLIFPAHNAKEVDRVLRLARDLGVKSLISGGEEADELAARLKAARVPVLLSLNFPKAPQGANPEQEEPLRVLRYRRRAPGTAARLQKAGVSFAFASDGLKQGRDFLANLRRTVREGLSREAALKAATLEAARILGVEQQLGTLEAGKIANIVVTDGDLFDKKTRIRQVFVDGEKYDVPRSEKKKPGRAAPSRLSGLWAVSVTAPDTIYRVRLDLSQQGSELSGTVLSDELGSMEIYQGRVEGAEFSFKIRVDFGMGPTEITFSGHVEGESLSGAATVPGQGDVPMEGSRIPRGENRMIARGGAR